MNTQADANLRWTGHALVDVGIAGVCAFLGRGRPAPEGFIYLVPVKEVVRVPLTEEDRAEVGQAVEAMRETIAAEQMPPPTFPEEEGTESGGVLRSRLPRPKVDGLHLLL